jgi:hypothetical protein
MVIFDRNGSFNGRSCGMDINSVLAAFGTTVIYCTANIFMSPIVSVLVL